MEVQFQIQIKGLSRTKRYSEGGRMSAVAANTNARGKRCVHWLLHSSVVSTEILKYFSRYLYGT
jgi:hypothetical protein